MFSLLATTPDLAQVLLALGIGAGFGVAGAAHCAGMCGAFPLAAIYGASSTRGRLGRALLYNGGRTFTYLLIGMTAAAIGMAAVSASGLAEAGMGVVRVLSVITAVVIAIAGLFMLGVRLPLLKQGHGGKLGDWLAGVGRGFMRSKHPAAPLAIGVLNGLLPCPLVYGMVVVALLTGAQSGLLAGVALTLGFALGTLPIMLAIPLAGGPVLARLKPRMAKVAGVFLLLMAAGITLTRGLSMEALHTILPGVEAAPHAMEHHDGWHMHARDERLAELIPSARGMDHAMLVDGVWIFMGDKPAGMSDEEYEKLHQREVELAREKEALVKQSAADVGKLRELDQQLSRPDGKRCFTLTKQNIEDILASDQAPEAFAYRCVCCGTIKRIDRKYIYEGLTLVLDESSPNPWQDSEGWQAPTESAAPQSDQSANVPASDGAAEAAQE